MYKVIATLLPLLLAAPTGLFAQESIDTRCDRCIENQSPVSPQPGPLRMAIVRDVREARRIEVGRLAAGRPTNKDHISNQAGNRRHHVRTGALVGAVMGAAFGWISEANCTGNWCDTAPLFVPVGAAVGAGVGAAIGLTISR